MEKDENEKIALEDIENFDEATGVLTLGTPITWIDGEEVTELTIRRPKARELREVNKRKKDPDADIVLLSKLTGKPAALLDELDAYDFVNLNKVVAGFTENSPKTGRSGS